MLEPRNVLTEWAAIVMRSLADSGVRHLVASPGSRSTPFLAAAIGVEKLTIHDVIDERAGAFLALGMARASAAPVALLCSSGTAAAHYYPAVIEASLSRIPLVLLTADRPNDLQECDAAQTIDQLKLFGSYARLFLDVGSPYGSMGAMMALRRMVVQAVATSRHPAPGPVHLNLRARKPLEPTKPVTEEEQRLHRSVQALLDTPVTAPRLPVRTPDPDAIGEIAERCSTAERGVILYGPAALADGSHREALFALARATGFVLFAETPSQMRLAPLPEGVSVCDEFDLVLRSPIVKSKARPDVVLQFGRSPTASGWEGFEPDRDIEHVVFAEHAWTDPKGSARTMCFGDTGSMVRALHDAVSAHGPAASRRGEKWRALFADVRRDVAAVIDAELASEDALGEGAAVRTTVEALPSGSILVAANSLAIRHLDVFARRREGEIGVVSQRGANGIDGLVAGTAGTMRALGKPVTLLIGDVSFLHDVASLMLLSDVQHPVVIVVLQNYGGRIFEQLPIASTRQGTDVERAQATLRHIVTEHSWDLSHAAALFRIAHCRVRTSPELRAALDGAYKEPRTTLVEVMVPPHGVSAQMGRIRSAADAALARVLGQP